MRPFGKTTAAPLVTRFTVGPPFTAGSWPRVSPDGRFVVFGTIVEGRNRFWIRALDDLNGRPLMNTYGQRNAVLVSGWRVALFLRRWQAEAPLDRIWRCAARNAGGSTAATWRRLERAIDLVFACRRNLQDRAGQERRRIASHENRPVGWRVSARLAGVSARRPQISLRHFVALVPSEPESTSHQSTETRLGS